VSSSDNIRIGKRVFGDLIHADRLPGQYSGHRYFQKIAQSYPDYNDDAWQIKAGSTGWTVSRLGIGTYRMHRKSREHNDALREALISGTNVIDTSANYMDGSAEALIGDVLRELISAGRLRREDILLVSKAGYIQGRNALLTAEVDFPEQTVFDRNLSHCIHPDFLENQLELSLSRLGVETLDVLLLHNPEYFLKKAKEDEQPKAAARAEYLRRLQSAFRYLEEARSAGKIQYYGISSNTFPVYGQYESTDLAELISEGFPGFRVVQFPANMIERGFREGPLCRTARDADLWTLANRPLNAFQSRIGLLRLAGNPGEDDSERSIEALIKLEEEMQDLEFRIQGALAEDKFHFDSRFPAAGMVIRYYLDRLRNPEQAHAATSALSPVLQKTVTYLYGRAEVLPSGEQEPMQRMLESYVRKINSALASLEKNVRARQHRFSRALAEGIRERVPGLAEDLSVIAMQYLLSADCPETALCGMRRIPYVRQMHSLYARKAPSRFRDGIPGLEQRAAELWSKEFGF
jgi:aryl-alcohol dehydrogenase-like predicted oxidoreductase